MDTVEFVRRLPRYSIIKQGSPEDPVVREIITQCCDSKDITALNEYTRGMYSEELHYSSFFKYKRPLTIDAEYGQNLRNHPTFLPAYNMTLEQLAPLKGTKIMKLSQIDEVEWIPSSAAGYGYVGKKADCYPLAKENAFRALRDFKKWGKNYLFVPDKAFARSQLALRANPKIRHVWGRAFHHILLEGLVAQPLIKKLLLSETPIFVGKDIHKDMPYSIIKLVDEAGFVYCLDFSSFDALICRDLISIAWNIIRELVILEDEEDKLVFEFIQHLFQHTPVVMPDGKLWYVYAGVPSGTYFTQLIDSIINLLLINMLLCSIGHLGRPLKVLGDDSIFVLPTKCITLEYAKEFFEPFGMKISDKSIITDNYHEIIFLGHNFYGSRVTRDDFTCLSLALYSEDPIKDEAHTIIRLSSLVYDCGFNSRPLLRLLKIVTHENDVDWSQQENRPVTTKSPFSQLFIMG